MPSGFKTFADEEFDRVFIKDSEIIDNFVGNRLWTWGANQQGKLGDNTETGRSSPGTTSGGGTNWKQVSCGGSASSGAIKTDGTLWTWGNDTYGKLGAGGAGGPSGTSRSSPVTVAGGGTNWKQVSMGSSASAAIKTDGTLWTWGRGTSGVLGETSLSNRSSPGTTTGGGTNWKQVSMDGSFSGAAIKTDGTLWTWGSNTNGQLGTGNTTDRSSPGTTAGGGTNWKQVSCGDKAFAAVKTDGTLWTCGYNNAGQLGNNSVTNRSSPGTTAGGGTNWKQVGIARTMCGAIKTDGTLWTWGDGLLGQLGSGNTTARSSPGTTVGGGTNWKTVLTHGSDVRLMYAAIKTDGTLWTWGRNDSGSLGTDNITDRSSPGTTVSNSNNWKQVSVASSNDRCVLAIAD